MSAYDPLDPLAPAMPFAPPIRLSHWATPAPAEMVSHGETRMEPAMLREPPITAQTQDIIDTVLADSDPTLADIQRCLRKNVATNPGRPSKALLAHLLETRGLSNSGL